VVAERRVVAAPQRVVLQQVALQPAVLQRVAPQQAAPQQVAQQQVAPVERLAQAASDDKASRAPRQGRSRSHTREGLRPSAFRKAEFANEGPNMMALHSAATSHLADIAVGRAE